MRTSIFFVTRKNHDKDDKKDSWVNIDDKEINHIFDIIEEIAEEDLTQIYC